MAERPFTLRQPLLAWFARKLFGLEEPREDAAWHANGWVPFTEQDGQMTCPMPADESIVEVMMKDGTIRRAWYSCNLIEAGDWDLVPVDALDEPKADADSLATGAVAWRHIITPWSDPAGEVCRMRDEIFRLRKQSAEALDMLRQEQRASRDLTERLVSTSAALQPFAALSLPKKPISEAGRYTIRYDYIRAARRAVSRGKSHG